MKRVAKGFTLIEVMIAVVVVGVLSAVAVPAYQAYVIRARMAEAFTGLGGVQLAAEQYWANNRTYVGTLPKPFPLPVVGDNFTYSVTKATTSEYVVLATGKNTVAGFKFTIDQAGNRATTGVPSTGGWTASTTCWVDRKGGLCTQ